MKYGDGKLSKEQKEFLRRAAEYGNFVAVCYSQEIALKVIEEYVKLNQQDAMPIENNKVIKTMAETIKFIGMLDYSDRMEEVMSVEEYIEKATEKGYKIEVKRIPGSIMTEMRFYKETDYKKEER